MTTATVKVRTDTSREALAVVLLTAGSVLPVLGWVAGVIVLRTSRLFRTGEKLAATLVLPGGLFAGWVAGSLITGVDPASCPASSASGCPGLPSIVGFAGGSIVLGLLVLSVSGPLWAGWRLRRRLRASL